MVLWQSDLRVSWRAQWISLLIHGLVAAVILLMPWPLSYTPLWMILLSLVVFDCVRSQRRINTCQGEIKLLMDGRLRWQGQDWTLLRPVLVTEKRDGVAFTRRVWTSSAFMAGGG